MPSSQEVLAPSAPPSRPVLRAVVTLVLVGLIAWGAVAKISGADPEPPAAAPPASSPAPSSFPSDAPLSLEIAPPLWVRYPNALEGRWRGDGPVGRLTLTIANARLTLTGGSTDRSVRTIRVDGRRVHVAPLGDEGELATYRWRIHGDRLTFRLLERTPKAALRLESLKFRRSST